MELKLNFGDETTCDFGGHGGCFCRDEGNRLHCGSVCPGLLFVAVLKPVHGAMLKKKFPRVISFTLTTILFILILVFIGWVLSMAISQTIAIGQQYGPEITQKVRS